MVGQYYVVWVYYISLVSLPIGGHLDGFQFLATVNKAAMKVRVQVLCEHRFSFLLSKNLKVELLGHMCLINILKYCLFSEIFEPRYIPTSRVREFQLLYIFAYLQYCKSF